jgi:predicted transcriptional regulator
VNKKEVSKFIKLSDVLSELRKSADPLRQTDLRDRTGKSKSTIHRDVRALEDMGVVEKKGPGYELTEFGEVIADRTEEYVSFVLSSEEYKEFMGTVAETDLSLKYISNAELTRTSSANPVAPLVRLAEVTSRASEVRVLTNSIAPESFEVGRKKLREGEQEVEIVIDSRTIESIRGSEWFGEEIKKDLETGNFELWVYRGRIPHQIGIMDNKLCLGAESNDRMPIAMLETEDERAVSWAEGVYRRYKRGSERLTASDV